MGSRADVAVVLPVKAFDAAKQRLRSVLNPAERAALAQHLATGVAEVATTAPGARLIVACDDGAVRDWAEAAGAEIAWTPGLGLNGAIDAGVDHAIESGSPMVVVSHADLARPSRLLDVVHPGTITVVPDRHRDGTNVVSFPADARLHADYGPSSFHRHRDQAGRVAAATGRPMRVFAHPDLALDVDTLTDLRHPSIAKELPAWLPTHPDNHSTPVG